jgi:hypothetical protein
MRLERKSTKNYLESTLKSGRSFSFPQVSKRIIDKNRESNIITMLKQNMILGSYEDPKRRTNNLDTIRILFWKWNPIPQILLENLSIFLWN